MAKRTLIVSFEVDITNSEDLLPQDLDREIRDCLKKTEGIESLKEYFSNRDNNRGGWYGALNIGKSRNFKIAQKL